MKQERNERFEDFLEKHSLEIMDRVKVETEERTLEGKIMPKHGFAHPEVITLKLDNGYNIGQRIDGITSVIKISSTETSREDSVGMPSEADNKEDPPLVHIIQTGGTIASKVDYRTGAVYPAMKKEDILKQNPGLSSISQVRSKVLMSVFSENIVGKEWIRMAREVEEAFDSGAKGVIIAHGTDTMGYSAAALSFIIRKAPGPVIFVGSQRSSDRPSTDASVNLISAVKAAIHPRLGGVLVAMHSNPSDEAVTLHPGTRVRKMHSSRRDAFKTVDTEPIARVRDELAFQEGSGEWLSLWRREECGRTELMPELADDVAMFHFYPGIDVSLFELLAEKNRGIVIAGTGLGHVGEHLFDAIGKAIENDVTVVMTSQCLAGRVNMNVYSTGRALLKTGVVSGEDMLPETALVKLMWAMGNYGKEKAEAAMRRNVAGEITKRSKVYPERFFRS